MQPYRFQKNKQIYFNDAISNSPDIQKSIYQQSPVSRQLQLQRQLSRLPSLHSRTKLLSKTSFLSKFTKGTDIRGIGCIEDLFESDQHTQEQILLEYHSFLIDLSVNELTVHWCGHSGQELMGHYYSGFQECVVRYCEGFMAYLLGVWEEYYHKLLMEHKKTMHQHCGKTQSSIIKVLKNLLEWYIQYLDTGFVHKKTIKRLLKQANNILSKVYIKYKIQRSQNQQIVLNIQKLDKMIQHYNTQMWKIEKNVSIHKLKIYQERKSPRNIIQIGKFKQMQAYNELQERSRDRDSDRERDKGIDSQKSRNKDMQYGRKQQKKRRRSENIISLYNIE